jgi:acyl-CoA synthetase (AMP-forming)/AMP-acid ligase II
MPAEDARTLIDLLEIRARETPETTAFTWENKEHTFGEIWEDAQKFAALLLEMKVGRGDRVLLAMPNGPEFFPAFYGTQLAGALPVPMFPGSGIERLAGMARRCGAGILVVPSAEMETKRRELTEWSQASGISLLSVADSAENKPRSEYPAPGPDDVAFIQYTSGSTGLPKGVMLTHRSLLKNITQLIEGMRITAADRFVSWLPVYHDMGLILKTMVPFYLAARLHLLPTTLSNVSLWLEAIQRERGTIVAAPDFAYRWCLRFVRNPQAYDITSLRVALDAAEPVRLSTIRDFEKTFRLENVVIPGYGLAEATVGVATWTPGTAVHSDPRGIVAVGRPFPGIEVRIVDHETTLPDGSAGEIMVKSPARTCGYFDNAEETSALFWQGDYIRTGDIGYLDAVGFLYVTGRAKNIIKHGGETIFPQEVEQIAESHEDVRRSAAIGIDRGGVEGEQLYLFVEMRKAGAQEEEKFESMTLAIVNAIYRQIGIRPGRVYFLKPRSIPLTHNGKIQYPMLRELYSTGKLRDQEDVLYPSY